MTLLEYLQLQVETMDKFANENSPEDINALQALFKLFAITPEEFMAFGNISRFYEEDQQEAFLRGVLLATSLRNFNASCPTVSQSLQA